MKNILNTNPLIFTTIGILTILLFIFRIGMNWDLGIIVIASSLFLMGGLIVSIIKMVQSRKNNTKINISSWLSLVISLIILFLIIWGISTWNWY